MKNKVKIPNYSQDNYKKEYVNQRLEWLEQRLNKKLRYLSGEPVPSESFKGNIENMIGVTQIPIGITGPLIINGNHANGEFFIPMATTEGAVITTYSIGMRVVSSSGGVIVKATDNGVHITPCFFTKNLHDSEKLDLILKKEFENIKNACETTTNHGKLLEIKTYFFENRLGVMFKFKTGDAMGLNMINVATEAGCKYIARKYGYKFFIRSNFSADKKISVHSITSNVGKSVFAEAVITRKALAKLKVTPEEFYKVWITGYLACTKAHMLGINSQAANGIAGIFMACGQDLGEVNTSAIVHNGCEITENGDLYFSVSIPSLAIGTVGGGTGVGTNRECLEILDCYGSGKVMKLAEIIGAAILCGEITTLSAVANKSFVHGHEKFGRNKNV